MVWSGLLVFNLFGEWNDFYDMVVFVMFLDLIILICLVFVYLVGVLGLFVWVMFGVLEWCWGVKGDVGFWYLNVCIFC